ncbi:MAG: hypothetical protein U5J97_08985 [Trueperaceae bacterium]|nr:hypothetical protein [Trueperaceae bacterium]
MGWFERQTKAIVFRSTSTIVDARPEFGLSYVFEEIAGASTSFIWITLEAGDDSVAIGNKLSRAVRESVGATLFGTGMPYSYALNYLVGLSEELGPLFLLVNDGDHNAAFCRAAVVTSIRSRFRLKVAVAGSGETKEWRSLVADFSGDVMTEKDLEVTPAEVREMTGADEGVNQQLLGDNAAVAGVPYEHFLQSHSDGMNLSSLRGQSENARAARLSSRRRVEDVPPVLSQAELTNAFEDAVRLSNSQSLEMLDDVGEAYFAQGQVLRFKHLLTRLVIDFPRHPVARYWWFQAYAGLGEQSEIQDQVAAYLEKYAREAPALSAAYASVVRPKEAMSIAQRAMSVARTPETVAAVGFLNVVMGDLTQGISLFKEAFDGYRKARRHHRSIQLSNSIGSVYVQLGEYRRAILWARKSLEDLRKWDIREELLRLSSINLLTYAQLLVGDIEAGEEQLKRVQISVDVGLPPTLEGLVSTFGDYALVNGRPAEATRYYESLYRQFSSQLPGYAARHFVRGLLHQRRFDEAATALAVAEELAGHSDESEKIGLRAADVLIKAARGSLDRRVVSELLSEQLVASDAVLRAELTIAAAANELRSGNERLAHSLLLGHSEVLIGLGRSGWVLLAPPDADVDRLQRLVGSGSGHRVRLNVFGSRLLEEQGNRRRLSLRFAELFVILAMHPEGLNGEALLYELYGEMGQMSTLKATVSRARQIIDIQSIPYRFAVAPYVDAVDLETCLAAGDTRQALELYKGPLLPESEAPGVIRARERIDEAVRQAVMHAGEADLAVRLARKFPEDLELWEAAKDLTPKDDPAYPLIRARVRRIRGEWGL